jgi:flagellar basal body-associated protein FliL
MAMKRNRVFRLLAAMLAVVLCTAAFTVPAFAFASGDDYASDEAGNSTEDVTLTPDGNLSLVDDILQDEAGKQFITVQSKNGNYFYLIIDRSGDTENVYFLNLVDEADLLALIEDDQAATTPIVCTCTDKCVAGDVDTTCPVCKDNMSECTGKEAVTEPTPEPDTETEPQAEQKSSAGAILALVLILAAAGGGAYYFLMVRPKQMKNTPSDLDDLDLEDEEEYLTEDDTEETK